MPQQTAFAYVRVSSEGQHHDRQVAAIESFAKRQKIHIARWFSEKASGTKGAESRQALRELLASLALNGVSLVLIESSDRMARDVAVFEDLARACVKLEVTVLEVTTGSPWVSPETEKTADGRMVRRMRGVIDSHARDLIVERMAEGRTRKRAETGRCEGRKPFGHYPGESETLKLMRNLKSRRRLSYRRVARVLNEEGRPTRTGAAWSGPVVRRILRR